MNEKRTIGFWVLIIVALFLSVIFLLGQTLAVFNYDLTVKLGLQESSEEIGSVGIAFAKGFGFADTVFYIPLILAGVIGLFKRKSWGLLSMFGALAITVYWPLVHLYTIFVERTAITLSQDTYISFIIILPLIIIYSLWGMYYLYKNKEEYLK
jgi:hypothetical protein